MRLSHAGALAAICALAGCASAPPTLPLVDEVDLPRFMGDWYVIANIPTAIEKEAHNAVESYELTEAGDVATTFRFNKGDFDGPVKVYTPKGFVRDHPSNAVWGMRFIWPIKAEYLVTWLNDDYTQTVIGRSKRDYVWIMAREPVMPKEDYRRILAYLDEVGYDTSRIRKVPQRWPQP
jgi:apolipoprotein D and lipocalin family protein